jgi:DUF438 domain-containing protein
MTDKTPEQTPPAGSATAVKFEFGELALAQIRSLLDTIPLDLSFVDSHDVVRYFNVPRQLVFERSESAIGRSVLDCHSPQSVPLVKQVLEDLRSGRKDEVASVSQRYGTETRFRYLAVRSKAGEYLGCLCLIERSTAAPEPPLRSPDGSQDST